jgi:hypothetical protein
MLEFSKTEKNIRMKSKPSFVHQYTHVSQLSKKKAIITIENNRNKNNQ